MSRFKVGKCKRSVIFVSFFIFLIQRFHHNPFPQNSNNSVLAHQNSDSSAANPSSFNCTTTPFPFPPAISSFPSPKTNNLPSPPFLPFPSSPPALTYAGQFLLVAYLPVTLFGSPLVTKLVQYACICPEISLVVLLLSVTPGVCITNGIWSPCAAPPFTLPLTAK